MAVVWIAAAVVGVAAVAMDLIVPDMLGMGYFGTAEVFAEQQVAA